MQNFDILIIGIEYHTIQLLLQICLLLLKYFELIKKSLVKFFFSIRIIVVIPSTLE